MDSRLIMPPSLLLLLSEPSCVDVTDTSSGRLQRCSQESKLVWLVLIAGAGKYKQSHCADRSTWQLQSCNAYWAAAAILVYSQGTSSMLASLPLAAQSVNPNYAAQKGLHAA